MNKRKNRILYSIVPNGQGTILNLSVDSRNVKSLKNFYEILEKKYGKEIEGELTHSSSYSNLKIFLDEGLEKSKEIFSPFIDSLKNDINLWE